MTTELQRELDTYARSVRDWPEHAGKFVLIKEDEVVGFYSTYEDAITEGYSRFQLAPFLVKQVSMIEQACFSALKSNDIFTPDSVVAPDLADSAKVCCAGPRFVHFPWKPAQMGR